MEMILNDGTSQDRPWRTLARLNKANLLPGDKILLEKGSLWYDAHIKLGVSDIFIDSFGNGEKPKLYGSYLIKNINHLFEDIYWFDTNKKKQIQVIILNGLIYLKKKQSYENMLDEMNTYYHDIKDNKVFVNIENKEMVELLVGNQRAYYRVTR